ncbi:CHAT domain-containing protein [Rhodocollybia butyracea]|uniref:CHAT domain-containing protein n=1 Tax=Rhodocollybia butyracea TaxID=206335 RepID=A0A9P5Q3R9_9AGAR|nr:CHAT domain-containing protein [Rhodocollybia butyracea]
MQEVKICDQNGALPGERDGLETSLLNGRVDTTRSTVAELSQDHPEFASACAELSEALYDRFTDQSFSRDLYESLDWARKALEATPPDDPLLPNRKSDIATTLESIGRLDSDPLILKESITLNEEAVAALRALNDPTRRADYRVFCYNLAVALSGRFQSEGQEADLRRSLDLIQQVIDDYASSHDEADPDTLHQQGTNYYMLFDLTGNTNDLEKSLELLELALSVAPFEEYRRRRIQAAIARSLHQLYVATGDSAHLTLCIDRMRIALSMTIPDSTLFGDYQSWLGAFLFERYRHTQEMTVLQEAILLERACLSSTPQNHPLMAFRLANLGRSLYLQYKAGEDYVIASESIDLQKQAIGLAASNENMLSWWKHRLSETYLLRFRRVQDDGDLQEALRYSSEASESISSENPVYTSIQLERAQVLEQTCKDDETVELVLERFRLGLQCSSSLPEIRMECALDLAKFAVKKQRFLDALDGYRTALALMPEVLWFGLNMSDPSIAANAAACSLFIGNAELAIELLEQGRSHLWSQAVYLTTDVSDLDKEHPGIATDFRLVSSRLRATWASSSDVSQHRGSVANTESSQNPGHHLYAEWRSIVDKIRTLPGFNRFLRPTLFSRLQEAAREGAIVILNGSPLRADALILTANQPVCVVPLERVEFPHLECIAQEANRGLMRGRPPLRGVNPEGEQGSSDAVETTHWIWDHIVACIIEPPRFSDLFFISYTPTIMSLLRARESATKNHGPTRVLAIGQTTSTFQGFSVLKETSTELKVIARHIPSQSLRTLEEDQATVEQVTKEMPSYHFVHFACHAHQDEEPLESCLHMRDGPLKIGDLIRMQLHQAEFAFLSCCETATGTREMPDEALHLAAALQFAGFQSVISTLWSIDDWMAPRVANAVYRGLFSGVEGPDASRGGIALGMAIRQLKNKFEGISNRLIPYVHIGV